MTNPLQRQKEKFSYTDFENEVELHPLHVKTNLETTFALLNEYVKDLKIPHTMIDSLRYEIFTKEADVETTYCLAQEEDETTFISVNTYAKKKGITYDRLLKTLENLRVFFALYII